MDVREKLVELLEGVPHPQRLYPDLYVDYLVANGVTVRDGEGNKVPTKWISVKDGLPEDNGKLQAFLVCRNQPSSTSGKVLIQTEFFTNAFSGNNNVTHWMPLPQPPKGE